jgi:hypothetical protein
MEQKGTEYKPTAAEKRLLEVLLNPDNRWKSVTAVCSLANCTRKVYYKAFKKPGFVTIYKDEAKGLVEREVLPVLHAFVQQAKGGSYQHGKALLEMAGVYVEKTEIALEDELLKALTSSARPADENTG